MAGTSTLTKVVALRLPKDVVTKARVSAASQHRTLSNYLASILLPQLTRKQ